MLKLIEIRTFLKAYAIPLYRIAKEINIPYPNLWYQLNRSKNPQYYTIEKISDYIESIKQGRTNE